MLIKVETGHNKGSEVKLCVSGNDAGERIIEQKALGMRQEVCGKDKAYELHNTG